jgi:hypothetical protein
LRLCGTLAWLSGDRRLAQRRWQESLATADRLRLPVDGARVKLEMGCRLDDPSLVEEARSIFDQTGAKVDLAFSLHALARIAARSSRKPVAAISRYDGAITLLESVKAEHAFGFACRERAQLLAQSGRKDDAREDFARASRSFEAVGADADKLDVEKSARTLK